MRSCAYDYDTQRVHVVQRMHATRADKLQQPVKTIAHKKHTMCFANRVQARIIPCAVDYSPPPTALSVSPPSPPPRHSLSFSNSLFPHSCFLLGNINYYYSFTKHSSVCLVLSPCLSPSLSLCLSPSLSLILLFIAIKLSLYFRSGLNCGCNLQVHKMVLN